MRRLILAGFAVLAAAVWSVPSYAATYNLSAGVTTVTMPDGAVVTVWGYALNGGAPTVPGPVLTVPPGDTTLTVNLTNNLTVPTSLVVPGLGMTMAPVRFADAQGRQRVRSMVAETAPATTQTYTFTGVKPGTYLYHSGTHIAVQVQMGLYGAIRSDAGPGLAYPGISYKNEVLLLYSELDPALHQAVVSRTYGTAVYPSTFDYKPKYCLVNGKPFTAGEPTVPAGNVNETVLLRFVNAGLRLHVATMHAGPYMRFVAEDGNAYPYSQEKHSAVLPPLKTMDAVWVPGSTGTFALWDRSLCLMNNALPGGGLLTNLLVGTAVDAPVAVDDTESTAEDTVLTVVAPGVLTNDTNAAGATPSVVAMPGSGTVTLNVDGSFTYTPALNFNGSDQFTYKLSTATSISNTATVQLTVTPVNDAPTAVADISSTTTGTPVTVTVLANDSDIDGDALTVVPGICTSCTALVNANQSVTITPDAGFTGAVTFSYQAQDPGGLVSAAVTLTVNVGAPVNVPPVAFDDAASTKTNTPIIINLTANDTDPDGTILPNTVTITSQPNRGGTVVNNLNGTVTYTPKKNFRGTDVFTYRVRDNSMALSNQATVRVNVVK
jgi:FtsP/CotA-like multicopper oxidase with cupredoxin domain